MQHHCSTRSRNRKNSGALVRSRVLANAATRLLNAVIRFRSPLSGTTVVEDVIKGNIVFQNTEQDDFVICRSDGTPTYNFVVVVDDITMGINTVIRGDDHVMNTPKQILLYNALRASLPVFGHSCA